MRLPAWHPHLEVWLLVLVVGLWYRRVGPTRVPEGERPASRVQMVSFGLGLLTILLAADWPIHDLAERYLFSVHMFQHMLISLVAPPLLLLGMPPWFLRRLLRPPAFRRVVQTVTRPFFALLLFNTVVLITHWPPFVEIAVRNELFHFCAHTLLFSSALCMWWPVVSPLPEMPTLSYPTRMLYLFLQSIVPTVPASFLTFGSTPLYPVYETFPRIWGISALTDMRIAGLEMKLLGGAILFSIIAVIFFKWYAQEQQTEGWDAVEWGKADRDLEPNLPAGAGR